MNAYFEIIEKLIESIPPSTWHKQPHFPFKFLENPKSHVFDICIFEISAYGAFGFLWIEFDQLDDLFLMPFQLTRYQESNNLISLPPWSLQCVYENSAFYESWRNAQNQKNPLITAYQGTFLQKKYNEESSFITTDLGSDIKKMRIRIDCQIVYKIFRTIERNHPQALEVDFLHYLGNQKIFPHFAKLISVFEYSGKDINQSHSAISMRYIQNSGALLPHYIDLISQNNVEKILSIAESLGRLLGDFHTAMALAKTPNLLPEQTFGELKNRWLETILEKAQTNIKEILYLQSNYNEYKNILYHLSDFTNKLAKKIALHQDLGLRIRNHGNLYLEQILISNDNFFLLDYDSDDFESSNFRRLKQPCLSDVATLISSIKFSWFFSRKESKNFTMPESITLKTIESIFLKSYKNSLFENINTSYLLPKDKETEQDLLVFSILICLLKETKRKMQDQNPLAKIWLVILDDFLSSQSI
jgi:hypothetical protein